LYEYEKGYIESRMWLPCLGDNFLVNNNVDAKSDITSLESMYILHMCGKFGANRDKFVVSFALGAGAAAPLPHSKYGPAPHKLTQ
jgi:hypothetical protein